MQKLSKTQVIALFLGAASAQTTPQALFGGPADASTSVSELVNSSSGTECNGNADCAADGEKCAKFQYSQAGDDKRAAVNLCLAEQFCGALGKIDGITFYSGCWDTPAEGDTAVQPDDVDTDTFLAEVEAVITKETYTWANFQDLIVSPLYNYQDGWWYLDVDGENAGKWVEYDKPADNRCFIDMQCEAGECCGLWPDNNSRRCMSTDLHLKAQTAGPFTFTPTCPNMAADDAVPENAQDDIAKGALTEAEDALNSFKADLVADAKTAAGYDDMTDEEKAAFDEDQKAAGEKSKAFYIELRALAGYDLDDCDDTCKAIVEDKILSYAKSTYESCKLKSDSTDCENSEKLAKAEWEALGKEYFTSDAATREAKDAEAAEAKAAEKSNIVAAEIAGAADGTLGGKCGGETEIACVDETHCCATATPGADNLDQTVLDGRCGPKDVLKYEIGEQTFTIVCKEAALKLASVAAAGLAAALYLQ